MNKDDRHNEFLPGGLKPLYWALFVYAALIPVAYWIAIIAPGRKNWSVLAYAAVTHGILSALVAFIGKAIVSIVEVWVPKSRLRLYTDHIRNFVAALAVWPVCIAIFLIFWTKK